MCRIYGVINDGNDRANFSTRNTYSRNQKYLKFSKNLNYLKYTISMCRIFLILDIFDGRHEGLRML